jgi:hypothetical protein
LLLFVCASCVTLTTPRSAVNSMTVPDAPALAAQKAVKAAMTMGGQITLQTTHAVSARLNKAVILNVTLTPHGTATVVQAQATAEAGYILPHDVTEDVQTFFTAYGKEEE